MKKLVSNLLGTIGMMCLIMSIVLSPAISNADVASNANVIENHCGAAAGNPNSNPVVPCTCPDPNAHCLLKINDDGDPPGPVSQYNCTPKVRDDPDSDQEPKLKKCNCEC